MAASKERSCDPSESALASKRVRTFSASRRAARWSPDPSMGTLSTSTMRSLVEVLAGGDAHLEAARSVSDAAATASASRAVAPLDHAALDKLARADACVWRLR